MKTTRNSLIGDGLEIEVNLWGFIRAFGTSEASLQKRVKIMRIEKMSHVDHEIISSLILLARSRVTHHLQLIES